MRCPNCQFDGDPDDYAICTECGQPRLAPPMPPMAAEPAFPPGLGLPAGPGSVGRAPHSPLGGTPAVGSATRPARLVGLEGPVDGQEFPIVRSEMEIGRRNECDIVVADPSVSRRHARIRLVTGGCLIEDLESANGTWVNGVRLSGPQPLFERDVIRIGKAAFTFHAEIQAAPMPPGSQTMVSDLGSEPNPFGEPTPPVENVAPVLIEPLPAPEPVQPRPVEPTPVRTPPPAGARARSQAGPLATLAAEVAELRTALAVALERADTLSERVQELGQQPSPTGDRADVTSLLSRLNQDLETQGGEERYRNLRRLLDELRQDPTDIKLLLRLADELPAVDRLVQVYLRALSTLRTLGSNW